MALVVVKTDTTVATEAQLALVAELNALKQMRDDLDYEIEKAAEAIKATLDGVGSKVTKENGKPLISYSAVSTSGKFDREAFKAAHPQIFNRFWTPGVSGAGTPRLTVTP